MHWSDESAQTSSLFFTVIHSSTWILQLLKSESPKFYVHFLLSTNTDYVFVFFNTNYKKWNTADNKSNFADAHFDWTFILR